VSIAVPTAVRVEAGWDRTAPAWAFINRLRIADLPLDASQANAAAAIRNRTQVSVADAHLGAAIQSADQVTVVTSDPPDMQLVAEGKHIEVVAL
jgi:predicted nucleic acid-binding protein